MPFKPTIHPVLGLPSIGQARAMGERAWQEVMVRREEIIRREKAQPFEQCWEPPIWRVTDAIMGMPWVDKEWAERMRRHLGFEKPAPVTLINGGNRAGKSQYAAHRVMRTLRVNKAARAWCLHSTLPMSRQYQQPLFYHYLPASLRAADVKSKVTYVAYKQKTGFTEEQFVLPPVAAGAAGSDCMFKTYDQDKHSIEGGNLEIIWPDELVPADWIETLEFRIAEKNGWMPITFTPIEGYSATVKLFQDGAEVVKWSTGFLLPLDGGPPDVARALGFCPEETGASGEEVLKELAAAAEQGRASRFPQSVPERCDQWIEEERHELHEFSRKDRSQPEVPKGREFERVPRVMKCVSEGQKRAVVFFHSSDNPYGNPKEMYATLAGATADKIKERFYGVAFKEMRARFPKFSTDVHVVGEDEVPSEGTNYLMADPCSGRNFFLLWIRVTPERAYVYREWPGSYPIRGVGVPGPWALPDGKKADGRPGPAQKTFGFGLLDYKRLIAELEQWKDADNHRWTQMDTDGKRREPAEPAPSNELARKEEDGALGQRALPVSEWDENNGAREMIQERRIDARFASSPKLERDRPTTLITDFEDIGLFFLPARGDDIAHGVQRINDLLNYDEERPRDYFNQPRLLISAECRNLIYALQTWTGQDGQKGATKDPIETLYRFCTDDCPFMGVAVEGEEREKVSEWESVRREYY